MALDTSIPLAGQNIDVGTPLRRFAAGQRQQRQDVAAAEQQRLDNERQAGLDAEQSQLTQTEIEAANIKNLGDKEMQEVKSFALGAAQLLPFISGDNPDIEGAKAVVRRRHQGLVDTGRNTDQTDQTLATLNRGDINEIKALVPLAQADVALVTKHGVFGSADKLPAAMIMANAVRAAEDAGDDGMANLLREFAKTGEKGTERTPTGDVQPIPGALDAEKAKEKAKKLGKLEAEIEKGGQAAKVIKDEEFFADRRKKLPKARGALNNVHAQMDKAIQKIDSIIPRVGSLTAGWAGSKLEGTILGQDATDVLADLETLQSVMAFSALAELKASSPSGGGVGGLSDGERVALASSRENVAQTQSAAQLRRNLSSLKEDLIESKARLQKGFDGDFADVLKELASKDGISIVLDEPSATNTFNTPEEAEAADLPVGTEITIGGRKAVIE